MDFKVVEIANMKGLLALKSFEKGDVVLEVKGERILKPSRTSVQIASGHHIDVKAPLMYVNHSCQPNIHLVGDKFIATKPIKPNDEVVFNYNDSEDELAEPFVCNCCQKLIKGRKHISPCLQALEK